MGDQDKLLLYASVLWNGNDKKIGLFRQLERLHRATAGYAEESPALYDPSNWEISHHHGLCRRNHDFLRSNGDSRGVVVRRLQRAVDICNVDPYLLDGGDVL